MPKPSPLKPQPCAIMFRLCTITLGLAAFTSLAHSQQARAALPMRDAATHEQLEQLWRKAQQEDPTRKLKPAKGPDPALTNAPLDLISQSDILCLGGHATLVPKRAVLHIPENLALRLKFQPGVQIQSWADFYAQNRGWITTLEVSRVQAEGNEPLAADVTKVLINSSNLVVATFQGGPISVLPLKAPTPATPPVAINPTEKVQP